MKGIAGRRRAQLLVFVAVALIVMQGAIAAPGDINTYAGGTVIEEWGGEVRDFDTLNSPSKVLADPSNPGDRIIVEAGGNRIRRLTSTSITTLAGATGIRGFDGDGGPAKFAKFAEPTDAAFDLAGNLYVTDSGNHRIRKIDMATGVINTFAGDGFKDGNEGGRFNGDGLSALGTSFNSPSGIAIDSANNIYVADRNNHRIRKIDAANGIVTTVAGSGLYLHCGDAPWPNGQEWPALGDGGVATAACVSHPWTVRLRGSGLYLTDTHNHRIRKVDLSTGIIETIAGSGCKRQYDQYFLFEPQPTNTVTATTSDGADRPCSFEGEASTFTGPPNQCVARAPASDLEEETCLEEEPTTYYDLGGPGDGVTATAANLAFPRDIQFDSTGNLLIADTGNSEGGCPPSANAICGGHRIRKVDATTNVVTTVVGNGTQGSSGDGGLATAAEINQPGGLLISGATLEFADLGNEGNDGSARIRRVDAAGIISSIAGTGSLLGCCRDDGFPATLAQISNPRGMVVSPSGDTYVSDSDHHRIVRVSSSGIVHTIAGKGSKPAFPTSTIGDGGPATNAELHFPRGLALDAQGNLYIADTENHRIRRVSTTGIISTVAGGGAEASLPADGDGGSAAGAFIQRPFDVAVDSAGNLYIAEPFMQRIRRVDTSGIITTIAGSGAICPVINYGGNTNVQLGPCGRFLPWGTGAGLGDRLPVEGAPNEYGKATHAKLNFPMGVDVDGSGNVYIADSANHKIRRVTPDGWISTVAGNGLPMPAFLPGQAAGTDAVSDQGSLGDGLPAASASLTYPHDVVVDSAGQIFIADTYNARVRRVDAAGIITTVAGNGCHGGWEDLPSLGSLAPNGRLDLFIDLIDPAVEGLIGQCEVGDGGPARRAALRWPVALALKGGDVLVAEAEAENQTSSQITSSYPGLVLSACQTATAGAFECTPESLLINMGYKSADGRSASTHRIRLVSGT